MPAQLCEIEPSGGRDVAATARRDRTARLYARAVNGGAGACPRGRAPASPPAFFQAPFISSAIRRCISSSDTCSTTAQIVHRLPPASFTVAER
jgi:hypothetical protein